MKEEILIQTGKFLVGCYARLLLNFDVLWLADYPLGAKIFAANHPTTTDPFFLGLLTREPMRILVTANAFEVPVFRSYLHGSGHIPVHRGDGRGRTAVNGAVEYLEAGNTIGIFPEGALSPERENGFSVLPARSGVARIALRSGRPIIPVGISLEKSGIWTKEYRFSDRDTTGRWMIKGAYAVTVGPPIYAAGDPEDRERVREVSSIVTDEIRKLAARSEDRLKQHRPNWHSVFSFPKTVSPTGD
jgi:1-acyl-sn-glycerol-3-phosphate acyltransferase